MKRLKHIWGRLVGYVSKWRSAAVHKNEVDKHVQYLRRYLRKMGEGFSSQIVSSPVKGSNRQKDRHPSQEGFLLPNPSHTLISHLGTTASFCWCRLRVCICVCLCECVYTSMLLRGLTYILRSKLYLNTGLHTGKFNIKEMMKRETFCLHFIHRTEKGFLVFSQPVKCCQHPGRPFKFITSLILFFAVSELSEKSDEARNKSSRTVRHLISSHVSLTYSEEKLW